MSVLHVCELSVITPLGAVPQMIKAAVDAGLNSYQRCSLPGSNEGDLTFSPVPDAALRVPLPAMLPGLSPPQIRLLRLATFALLDLRPNLPGGTLPLFLAGPDTYYPGCGVNPAFINNLLKATGITLDFQHSRYLGKGRAGFMEALDCAFRYVEATGADYALVGGIDCFYDLRTLGILAEQQRVTSEDVADGFVPGEGAGFLLVAAPHVLPSMPHRPWLTIHRPALTFEPGHMMGNQPYRAQALAPAARKAIANAGSAARRQVTRIISAENGEAHYTSEVSLMTIRNQHQLVADLPILRLAEHFGDLGAAFSLAAIALASVDMHTQTGITLVTAGSDSGLRGALALSAI